MPEPGLVALARERQRCPLCEGDLQVTPGAEVCRNRECTYLVLVLDCGACGRIERWRYDPQARHRWVRLRLGNHPSVMACSAACGVLLLDEMAGSGGLLTVPGARPTPEPGPERER